MTTYTYDKTTKKLFKAFASIDSIDEAARFCRDLMTESEIIEFSGRFAAAEELQKGKSQRQVSKDTGVSIATVTRVNQWLIRGMDGYKSILSKINHTTPHREG